MNKNEQKRIKNIIKKLKKDRISNHAKKMCLDSAYKQLRSLKYV